MTTVHRCRWPGCPNPIDPTHWGCLEHWGRLPDSLKQSLTRTRFAWAKSGTPTPEWQAVVRAATTWATSGRLKDAAIAGASQALADQELADELGIGQPSGQAFPCCFGVGEHKPACRNAPRPGA